MDSSFSGNLSDSMVRLWSIFLTRDKFIDSVTVFVCAHCSRPTAARLALRGTRAS